jgi:hypothetical protein
MRLVWGKEKSFCPRALSRNKMRSLMRHNRGGLTANSLFAAHGRRPGPGKFRRSGLKHLDKLEQEVLAAGEQHRETLLRNRVLQLLRLWKR